MSPPSLSDQQIETAEDKATPIILAASDADGDPLTIAVSSGPAHGTLSGTPPEVVYTPAADFNGGDSFTFKANDGINDSNTATVSIMVMADTTRPTGSIQINNGAASTNSLDVLLNFTAADTGGSGLASMRSRNDTADPYSELEPYQTDQGLDADKRTGSEKGLRPVPRQRGQYLGRQSGCSGRSGLHGHDRTCRQNRANRLCQDQ